MTATTETACCAPERRRLSGHWVALDQTMRTTLDELDIIHERVRAVAAKLSSDPCQLPDLVTTLADLEQQRVRMAAVLGERLLARTLQGKPLSAPDIEQGRDAACDEDSALELPDDSQAAAGTTPASHPGAEQLSQEYVSAYFRERQSVPTPQHATAPPPTNDRSLLRIIAGRLAGTCDPPADLSEMPSVECLDRQTKPRHLEKWTQLPAASQRVLLGLFAACVRDVQESRPSSLVAETTAREVYRRLCDFSRDHRPGHINGLARNRPPMADTWESDARDLYRRLVALAGINVEPTAPSSPRRSTRETEETLAPAAEPGGPPGDWPWWHEVAGRRAVMFGGDVREHRRVVLESAFRLAELRWVEGDRPRSVDSLVNSIKQGSVDILLVTRFASHKHSNALLDAARDAGICSGRLPQGYGAGEVQRVLEQLVSRRA